jgi:hypothetical protein
VNAQFVYLREAFAPSLDEEVSVLYKVGGRPQRCGLWFERLWAPLSRAQALAKRVQALAKRPLFHCVAKHMPYHAWECRLQ